MTDEQFRSYMKQESDKAHEALTRAVSACKDVDAMTMRKNLHEFVLHKFLLADTDCAETNLLKLASLSTRHIIQLTGGSNSGLDVSPNCTGTGSSVTKKILLLHLIQDTFGIKIQPERTADIETIDDVAEEILPLFL